MNRGRIQAQENNFDESESWATIDEITKTEGYNKTNLLKARLTPLQLANRIRAFVKLDSFINSAPANGYYSQIIKSFHHNPQNRKIRVDIEIRDGRAFVDNHLLNNG
ncbi:hypothetical protein [Sphingobacterium cellulitidis]|uniref:hypothetical protein n=1 Tax=Sphingobacterium cellulitidis TaxID=1768011 RepID=UPI003C7E6548